MTARQQVVVECDHPTCKASATLKITSRLDLSPHTMPGGWWISSDSFSPLLACPKHAAKAQAAESALHEWRKLRVKAQNKWVEAFPPPKPPMWLGRL